MIIAFSDTGGRTDATHAALLTAQAFAAAGDTVTVVRVCQPHEEISDPFIGGRVLFVAASTIDDAADAVRDASEADRSVVVDLALDGFRDPSLRKLVTVPVLAVGPYAADETRALALDTGDGVDSPTWFLGCRRPGDPAAFVAAMSRDGRVPRLMPVTLPSLTRGEAASLACGLPSARALRSGLLLVASLRRVAEDPTVLRVAGPASALPEADRIAVTSDERSFDERLRDLADALAAIDQGHAPTAEDLAGAPVLNDWSVAVMPVAILTGTVSTHPSIRNGRPVRTSQVFASDNATWARTISRLYVLGRPASAEPGSHLQ